MVPKKGGGTGKSNHYGDRVSLWVMTVLKYSVMRACNSMNTETGELYTVSGNYI